MLILTVQKIKQLKSHLVVKYDSTLIDHCAMSSIEQQSASDSGMWPLGPTVAWLMAHQIPLVSQC